MLPFYGRKLSRKTGKLKYKNLIEFSFFFDASNYYKTLKTLQKIKEPINLEIGFGSGENLIFQSKKKKEEFFLACDPFLAGSFKLKNLIEKEEIRNIFFTNLDFHTFVKLMKGLFFNRIYILFPDPWHKKKHNKRRLINFEFINTLDTITNKNAEILIATDNNDYANQIIKTFFVHSKFKISHYQSKEKKIELREDFFYQTKYFSKAQKVDSTINFFVVKK